MNVERWEGKGHRGLELLPSPEHADDSENTQLCPAGPSGAVFESFLPPPNPLLTISHIILE